ncbi:MAG TPA: hypothetical protein VE981_16765 [Planctomycetota bacterium]|nr:hypothetical protein [Planctomycetota bacterium]
MTLFAVLLLIAALLLTFVYQACVGDYQRLAGPDKVGAGILFAIVLPLRWICLAGVFGLCIAKGGFPWPASRVAQYLLVFMAHAVLGFISLMASPVPSTGISAKNFRGQFARTPGAPFRESPRRHSHRTLRSL